MLSALLIVNTPPLLVFLFNGFLLFSLLRSIKKNKHLYISTSLELAQWLSTAHSINSKLPFVSDKDVHTNLFSSHLPLAFAFLHVYFGNWYSCGNFNIVIPSQNALVSFPIHHLLIDLFRFSFLRKSWLPELDQATQLYSLWGPNCPS